MELTRAILVDVTGLPVYRARVAHWQIYIFFEVCGAEIEAKLHFLLLTK